VVLTTITVRHNTKNLTLVVQTDAQTREIASTPPACSSAAPASFAREVGICNSGHGHDQVEDYSAWRVVPCVWKYHLSLISRSPRSSPGGGDKGAEFEDNPTMSLDAAARFARMYARFAGTLRPCARYNSLQKNPIHFKFGKLSSSSPSTSSGCMSRCALLFVF